MPEASPVSPPTNSVDAVVIGRNEGERLRACIAALQPQVRRIVYVDSGSTDGSPALVAALGVEVVLLDSDVPFTAARARNAGIAALFGHADRPEFVQLVDGDCALRERWIETARAFLHADPKAALVFGRLRERFPQASIYNRLCDWEWNTPIGPARASGGNVLIRAAALQAVGGYRDEVIAAEDDEMCQRLLHQGWTLWRIAAEMAWHDAAILRFGQWWRRAVRAGHGFAQVGALHPGHFVAARRRVWVWGAMLPVLLLVGVLIAPALAVGVAVLFALSLSRVAWRFRKGGMSGFDALKGAVLVTLSKVPNLVGVVTWLWRRQCGSAARIIEYK